MIVVVFQSHDALASPPSPSDFNHALSVNGGSAVASGYSGTNTPANAIDGNSSTYWESSGTVGSLSVQFRAMSYVNEVHAHFRTTVYSYLSLYLDTSGNGAYETGERVWTTTKNGILDVVPPLTGPYRALGMRISIDLKNGSAHPKVNEFEAYLRSDTDGDGLTGAQEAATTYFQDARPGGLPQAIPDDGVNVSSASVSLAQFAGIPVRALANFTVDHSRPADLTAAIGYWNGTAWVDRYVWDPGRRFAGVGIASPDAVRWWEGLVPVVAVVGFPEATSKVEFRVDGILQATVTAPVGSEYRWTWNTTGLGDRRSTLNVTQYDAVAARAWSQIVVKVNNLAPAASWVSPAHLSTVNGVVTLNASASDFYGIQRVRFYADGVSLGDGIPKGGGYFTIAWDTTAYCYNGDHAISATATENTATAKSTTVFAQLFTNNDPLVCITNPAAGGTVNGQAYPVRASTVSALGITKVEFLVTVAPFTTPQLRFTDTAAPWEWLWDTTRDPNGPALLTAKAYNRAGGTDAHVIQVMVGNPVCQVGCGPGTGTMEASSAESSEPTATLGVLTAEWSVGETTSGSLTTVVADLSVLPSSRFLSNLQWRLVLRDWSAGTAGTVTAFALRFEARTNDSANDVNHDGVPDGMDTDGDGIRDGTEANYWRTLAVARDSDLDGLADGYEIAGHSLTVRTDGETKIWTNITSDPTKWDTDGDGLSDGQERGVVTTGQSKVIGEVGILRNITTAWSTVYLRNAYAQAVVIAEPSTFRDHSFSHVRIQGVTDHTFQVKLEKWLAGGPAAEDVSYLAVEAGNHVLSDGTVVEAGRATVSTSGTTVPFREAFATAPIVFVQAQPATATALLVAKRTNAFSSSSFDAYLNRNGSGTSISEVVGYVATSPQPDPTVLATWTRAEAYLPNQTGNWVYPANFSSTPLVLAWMRGEASGGNKNIGLRLSSVTNHSATIFREQSGTAPGDTIEFLAFAGPMNLTARMTTRPNGTGSADTDGDKLTDGTEVNTYGSDPTLKDTDADGLNDSAEVTSRSISVPINGTLKTITFTTSPTSDDTDADGVKDPDELAGMLDHRVLYYDMETLASGSTFRDMSGSGADGVAKFVQLTSATPKKVGNATLFNGTTGASANRVLVPSTPWLNLTGGFTILVWVYPTTTTQTSGAGIVAKGYGNSASYILDVVTSGSSKVFRAYVGGSTYEAKSTTAIAANTWYQVAAVYDPTAGTVQLYVNLNAPVLRTAVPAISTNSHDLSIGSRESSSTSGYDLSFKGRLDEVQIWDRPLTLSQIRSLYNATTASYRARLDFETRTSAGQLFDFSGTYHRGVVTGTSVVEGRTGFARRLVGGTDGIVLSSSS
ncbi:MAG TPA: Ig-like domain-containing protein, partial [Thermoplasmata archaeon]|nr:Ig-like domain-containing protein [Thermoplasmata archaeon]